MIPGLDQEDLLALKERMAQWPNTTSEQDAREVGIVVDELIARRGGAAEPEARTRYECRRDLMMMAAAIAAEIARDLDIKFPETRTLIATHALALALEIERLTPK